MKASLNWMKHYTDVDLMPDGIDKLVEKIGAQLGAVEEVINLGEKYQGIVVAKVVSCDKLENSDHLSVCKIDDGGKAQNVERDEAGHVQVVCGAPNVRESLTVAWLPPGTTVPSSFGKEPFVLETRDIRGQKSNGMLASAKELALGDSHEGLLEIDGDIIPGTDFAEAFKLNDYIIDIENKMFTHRPDLFGQLGLAREIAGIQGKAFKSPDWYTAKPQVPAANSNQLSLNIENELPDLVPRFTAVVMANVTIKPSPVWLQAYLSRVGIRPINNVVDLTNYFMMLTAQPLHAYDYDKLKALDNSDHATIKIRHPNPDEKITLLNGKEVEPRVEAIMIASATKLIGIGGVMGGAETEVDDNTKNIVLEVASFDMYSIRRTAMEHGIFTDAVTRFNKGQSPLQTLAVLLKIVSDIQKLAGGEVASPVIDPTNLAQEVLERESLYPPVTASSNFINARLGLGLSPEAMATLLKNVEFDVQVNGDELTVKAPFWRTDIEIPEDIVEEVGRLYGYDKLPLALPKRDITPAAKDPLFELKAKVRDSLSKAGANELLTYSFVHGNLLQKVGQNRDQAFQLSNALSPELQYYRLSLTPSLLEKVHPNIKAGFNEFTIFEIGKCHNKGHFEDDLPKEVEKTSLIVARELKGAQKDGAAYYKARKYLDWLAEALGLTLKYDPLEQEPDYQTAKPFNHKRSAHVIDIASGLVVGIVGEFKPSVTQALKLPTICAGFELSTAKLLSASNKTKRSVPLPRFPKVEQDICLKVSADKSYQELFSFVQQQVEASKPEQTFFTLVPLDIYQRDDDHDHKQVTFRLSIASYEKTMRDTEVNALLDSVAEAARQSLGAERI